MLGQFSGEKESDSSLDLPRGDGRLLVLLGQFASFGGDAFEDVVDERVHDAHRFARDSDIGVNLLQNVVDVDSVAFLSLPLALLLASTSNLSAFLSGALLALLGDLWGSFARNWFRCVTHDC